MPKRRLKPLKDLLVETPFVKDVDRAVALSLILTTILRGTLETSPLHIFVSPTAGSGKSYVVDIASLIATGRRCAVVAATRSSEEMEKRLGAAMLSGRPLISLDNLNGELSSDLLCQAVSQPVVSFRPLGASAEVSLTTRSVFAATGNNLSIADDLGRRTLLANIDARLWPWPVRARKSHRTSLDIGCAKARDRAPMYLARSRAIISNGFCLNSRCHGRSVFAGDARFHHPHIPRIPRAFLLFRVEFRRTTLEFIDSGIEDHPQGGMGVTQERG